MAAALMNKNGDDIFAGKSVEPLAFKTQVVAGINYFVKVRISNYIFHVRIYQRLPHENKAPEVVRVIGPKSETEPIEYFERSI